MGVETVESAAGTSAQRDGWVFVPCNLCGGDDAEEVYPPNTSCSTQRAGRLRCTDECLGQHGRVVRCRGCGLVYTNPRLLEQSIDEAYAVVEDPTYVAETEGRRLTFAKSLDLLGDYRAGRGRLLDIGCYTGVFLLIAQSRGWKAVGLEPSRWACRLARQQGLEVHEGTIAEAPWPTQSFDVITMWDVLEHLANPLEDLRRVRSLMMSGGHLALTTVDLDSLSARLFGSRWWWLMEMHLYYFTRDTVTQLLNKAGFEVLDVQPHVRVISVGYVWTRLEAYLGGGAHLLSRWGQALGVNRRHLVIRGGGLMTVVARAR